MDAKPPSLSNQMRFRERRSIFHLGIVVLIALASWLSGRDLSRFSSPAQIALSTVSTTASLHVAMPTSAVASGGERSLVVLSSAPVTGLLVQSLVQAPVPHTIIPERPRGSVTTYTVQAGDTVLSIAEWFGLRRETIVWSNQELEADPDMLYVGQVLNILPVDGVYHTVGEGDTLALIAEQYEVPVDAITSYEYNGLESGWSGRGGRTVSTMFTLSEASAAEYHIRHGQNLVVAGGVKPFKPRFVRVRSGTIVKDAPRGEGSFVWPVGGYVSQGYWNLHRGIDIAGKHGDVIVAIDAGVVVYAEWECSGYGNLVIIDHRNGFVSYYAHLFGFYVDVGQAVKRGQPIGVRGNTGRSTGAHIHLEIRHDGVQSDPLRFLPKE